MCSFSDIFIDEKFVDFYYQYLKSKNDSKKIGERIERREISNGQSFNGLKNAVIYCLDQIRDINRNNGYLKWICLYHDQINAEFQKFMQIPYLIRYQSIVYESQTRMKIITNNYGNVMNHQNDAIDIEKVEMKNSVKKSHQKFTKLAVEEVEQRIKAIKVEAMQRICDAFSGVEESTFYSNPQKLSYFTKTWYLLTGIGSFIKEFPAKFLFSIFQHGIYSFSISCFLSVFPALFFAGINTFMQISISAGSVWKYSTIFGGMLQFLFLQWYICKSVMQIQKWKAERVLQCQNQIHEILEESKNNFDSIINHMFEVNKMHIYYKRIC